MLNLRQANQGRAAVWILLLCLLAYRVFHLPQAAVDRIRASLVYWPLWVSAAIWILFSIYWEIAAKNAAPEARSESPLSRCVHVFTVNFALLLLFVPVPGLVRRFRPRVPRRAV